MTTGTVQEPTRLQERAIERLGWRHDSIRVTPLGHGRFRLDCLDRDRRPVLANVLTGPAAGGLRYVDCWLLDARAELARFAG